MLENVQIFLEVYAVPLAVTATGLGIVVWRIGSLAKAGFNLVSSVVRKESKEEREALKQNVSAQFSTIMEHIKVLEEKDEIDTMLKLASKAVPDDVKSRYREHKINLDRVRDLKTQIKETVETVGAAVEETKDSVNKNWLDV